MILITHGTAGAIAARVFGSAHPVAGLIAAFLSHFLLDEIPHWDYLLKSQRKHPEDPLKNKIDITHKGFPVDAVKVAIDSSFGILVPLFFFLPTSGKDFLFIAGGAFMGMLPDFLQFLYSLLPREPLIFLQKFHIAVHSKNRTFKDDYPVLGMILQGLFLTAIVYLFSILQS